MKENLFKMARARESAAYRLSLMGIEAPRSTNEHAIAYIERETGFARRPGETPLEYFTRFNRQSIKPVDNPRMAGRRYVAPFREYKPRPHPRQAELDAMPRQISMRGVGNGSENSKVWTR